MALRRVAVDRRLACGVAALSIAFLAYLGLAQLPHLPPHEMAALVRAELPQHDLVDLAVYYAVSGSRGLQTAICQNQIDPHHALHLLTGTAALLPLGWALATAGRREWPAALLVALPPLLFLWIVANDTSRWVTLSAFNLWLLLVTQPATRTPTPLLSRGHWRVAGLCVLAFLLLVHPKVTRPRHPVYAGSPLLEAMVERIDGVRIPNAFQALRACDPRWRDIFQQPSTGPDR